MVSRSWGTSKDGSLEYFSYHPKYHYDGLIDALEKGFYGHEQCCKALNVTSDPDAVKDLNELVEEALKDGVSIVAVDKLTSKVVGAAINKIQVKAVGEESFFVKFARTCRSTKSADFIIFMADADDSANLFDQFKVECLLELMFLLVAPYYRNKKIGEYLAKNTIEVAQRLSEGENVKFSIDDKKLSLGPSPKLVAALFTSSISQKVGQKCGFQIAETILYKDVFSSGKAWAGKTEDQHPSSKVVYKLL